MSLLQTKISMSVGMRDRVPNHQEYTLVPVDKTQEDPLYYPSRLFYMGPWLQVDT